MNPSPKTIRLYNVSSMQLSLHLQVSTPKASARLRRGLTLLPIRIEQGTFYDIVEKLDVSFEEAQALARSPEVLSHKNAKRMLVREYPAPPELVAEDLRVEAERLAAEKKTAELNPPDAPNAVGVGVDLAAAGLPLDTPRRTHFVPSTQPKEVVFEEVIVARSDDEPMDTHQTVTAGLVELPIVETEPSMAWTIDQLRSYALEHGIDLGNESSKTMVLKKIRKALSTR